MTDIDLLQQHRAGSPTAFTELVNRHIAWVYGMARRQVRDAHLADDITQAVFILLHRKAPKFPADRALIRWLHKTVWYASRVAQRNQRRRENREIEAAMQRPIITESPEVNELLPMLDELISRLSRADREAVLLRFYRDLTYPQLAAEIGSTEDAARKRVDRAVEKLRKFASEKGLTITGAIVLGHLTNDVRIAPPPGLIARIAGGSIANISASSASIVKGTTIMMNLKTALMAAFAGLVILATGTSILAVLPETRDQVQQILFARKPARVAIAPAIRWRDETPEVQVNDVWYELLAIDDVPAPKIVAAAKNMAGKKDWQRQIQEDMDLVYESMNVSPGPGNLQLRRLDNNEVATINAPPTPENRILIMFGNNPDPNTKTLFSGVRWKDSTAEVQINGNDTWYELTGVDDLPAADIFAFAKKSFGDQWQKQVETNSVQLVTSMGHRLDVMGPWLRLKTLDTHESVSILKRIIGDALTQAQVTAAGQGFPRLSPFQAVRWDDSKYQVEVNSHWYELVSIDDQSIESIIDFARTTYGQKMVQKRIDEDLVEVLSGMGHAPGQTVKLELRNAETGTLETLSNVSMTRENRQAILKQRNDASQVPAPANPQGL